MKLKKDLGELRREVGDLRQKVDTVIRDIGGSPNCWFYENGVFSGYLSMSLRRRIDVLCEHLGLEIVKEVREEKVVCRKKEKR